MLEGEITIAREKSSRGSVKTGGLGGSGSVGSWRISLTEALIFEQGPKVVREFAMSVSGERALQVEECPCKSPSMGVSLMCLKSSKQASMADAEWATGRDGDEVRQAMGPPTQSHGGKDFGCNFVSRPITVFGEKVDMSWCTFFKKITLVIVWRLDDRDQRFCKSMETIHKEYFPKAGKRWCSPHQSGASECVEK